MVVVGHQVWTAILKSLQIPCMVTDESLGRGLRKEGEMKVVEINVLFFLNLKVRQTNPALFSMAWSDRFFCELFILQI